MVVSIDLITEFDCLVKFKDELLVRAEDGDEVLKFFGRS